MRVISISREEILAHDISKVASLFNDWVGNREKILANKGSLEIFFDGYDEDRREIPSIPEIRYWWQKLDRSCRSLVYFLGTTQIPNHFIHALCIIPTDYSTGKRKYEVDTMIDFYCERLLMTKILCDSVSESAEEFGIEFAIKLKLEIPLDKIRELLNDEESEQAKPAYNPDFGMMLINDLGYSHLMTYFFYDFKFSSFAMIGVDHFTACNNMMHGETEYAVSVDFNLKQLRQILVQVDDESANRVIKWLNTGETLSSFNLSEPIYATIETTIGEIQTSEKDVFAPLIIQKVSEFESPEVEEITSRKIENPTVITGNHTMKNLFDQ